MTPSTSMIEPGFIRAFMPYGRLVREDLQWPSLPLYSLGDLMTVSHVYLVKNDEK